MALALLKFPDAPASFGRGLLETLRDEQTRPRLYMHRMEQCGIKFGELPPSTIISGRASLQWKTHLTT